MSATTQLEQVKLALIGAGAMGGALARGFVEVGSLKVEQIVLAEPNEKLRADFGSSGYSCYESAQELFSECDPNVVLIAVKPQIIDGVLSDIAPQARQRLLISVAAGVSLEHLKDYAADARIIRVMPNLGALKAEGAFAACADESATAADRELVSELLGALGTVCFMREDQLDVAGVVAGSGPAFFALLVDELSSSAVANGLGIHDARALIEQTLLGTARLLVEDNISPRELMERVSSPGGTTIAALRELEPALIVAVDKAVRAALIRTKELS